MDKYCIYADYLKNVKIPFGHISFNAIHANIDVVAIKMKGKFSGEVILIQYFTANKVGWIYFGDIIPHKMVALIYADVPDNRNDLRKYEEEFAGKVTVVDSARENYLFLNDREIIDIQNLKNAQVPKQKRPAAALESTNTRNAESAAGKTD